MKILGYSERGIINSLMYNIGEDKYLLKEFIKLISIPNNIKIGEPIDYEILLEQSFSRFGDSDLIIILHYNEPKDNIILFFEAKVKTSQGKWTLTNEFKQYSTNSRYKGHASNLFYQLYLKELLFEKLSKNPPNNIIADKLGVSRKIGENKVVLKAFNKTIGKQAYYIGIIPQTDLEINNFIKTNNYISNNYYFVPWEAIHRYCKDNNLQKVLEVFNFNEGQIF